MPDTRGESIVNLLGSVGEPPPRTFSDEDMRRAVMDLLPMKMEALGLPVTAENIAAITIINESVSPVCEPRITVICKGHVLLTPEEVDSLKRHLVNEHAFKQGKPVPYAKRKTSLINSLLYGEAGQDEPDPFEKEYLDESGKPGTPPPLIKEVPVVVDPDRVRVNLKKQNRRLG